MPKIIGQVELGKCLAVDPHISANDLEPNDAEDFSVRVLCDLEVLETTFELRRRKSFEIPKNMELGNVVEGGSADL